MNPNLPQFADDGAGALHAVRRAESERPEKIAYAVSQRPFDILQRIDVHLPRLRSENAAILGAQPVKELDRLRQRLYILAPLFPIGIAQVQAREVGVWDYALRDRDRSVSVRRLGGRPQAQRLA